MKTLLDLLIELLPEGAEIRNAKETTSRFKFDFVYNGGVSKGNMFKVCALGYEERFVTQEIASHMASILLAKGNASECRRKLGCASLDSFYALANRSRRGINKTYRVIIKKGGDTDYPVLGANDPILKKKEDTK